jgi:tetratricopeptide (TPR) repeat protein/serine/threonine protein kinase
MSTAAELLDSGLPSEPFVRQAIALSESVLRRLALLALADWERLAIVSPDLFTALAAVQRPSFGCWNGLIAAIRSARKSALRAASASERERIKEASVLSAVLDLIDEKCPLRLGRELNSFEQVSGASVSSKPRVGDLLTLPITVRNRIHHFDPTDPTWWQQAAEAMRPIVAFHAERDLAADAARGFGWPSPWFEEDESGVWSFNGLDRREDSAIVYASPRGGPPRISQSGTRQLLESLQRLMGRQHVQDKNFLRVLSELAPDEVKGVILGDYLVGGPVGEGCYGTVHLAVQLSTGRKAAVKILRDGMPESTRARFQQEAVYLSKFNHPGVVGVFGHGEEPWFPPRHISLAEQPWFREFSRSAPIKLFIAMEWIDGTTLEDVYREGRRATKTVVEWFAHAAGALSAVHAQELVHRDVKPSNLMLTKEGKIKLMDFGIARSTGEMRTLETTTEHALGTLAYMSPEQLRAADPEAEVGPATDIYSLCATFYELLTGTRFLNHDRESAKTVEMRKLSGERPKRPGQIVASLPWELDTILLGGLEPEVSDRYRSMSDLERDLRHYLNDEPIEYRKPSPARRVRLWCRRNPRMVAMIALVLLVTTIGASVGLFQWRQVLLAEAARSRLTLASYHTQADARLSAVRLLQNATDRPDVRREVFDQIDQFGVLRDQAGTVAKAMGEASGPLADEERRRWDERATVLRNEAANWLTGVRLWRGRSILLPEGPFEGELPAVALRPDLQQMAIVYPGSTEVLVMGMDGHVLNRLAVPEDVTAKARTFERSSSLDIRQYRSTSTRSHTAPFTFRYAGADRLEYQVKHAVVSWSLPDGRLQQEERPHSWPRVDFANTYAASDRFLAMVDATEATVKVREWTPGSAPAVVWQTKDEQVRGTPGLVRDLVFSGDGRALFIRGDLRLSVVDAATGVMAETTLADDPKMIKVGELTPFTGGAALVQRRTVDGRQKPPEVVFWHASVPEVPVQALHLDQPPASLTWEPDGLLITGGADHLVTAWQGRTRAWTSGIPYAETPKQASSKDHHRLPSVDYPREDRFFANPTRQASYSTRLDWHRQTWMVEAPTSEWFELYKSPSPYRRWEFSRSESIGLELERRELLSVQGSRVRRELYAPDDGKRQFAFPAEGPGRVLELSPDWSYAVVVTEEEGSRGTLQLWSTAERRPLATLGRYTLPVPPTAPYEITPLRILFTSSDFDLEHCDWLLICRPHRARSEAQLEIWRLPQVERVGDITVPTLPRGARPTGEKGCFLVTGGSLLFPPQYGRVINFETLSKVCDLSMYEDTDSQQNDVPTRDYLVTEWRGPLIVDPVHVGAWHLRTGRRIELGIKPWMAVNGKLPTLTANPEGNRLLICGNRHDTEMAHVELWNTADMRLLNEVSYPTEGQPEVSFVEGTYVTFKLKDFPEKDKTRTKHWRWADGAELPEEPSVGPRQVLASQTPYNQWRWTLSFDRSGLWLQTRTDSNRTLLANSKLTRAAGARGKGLDALIFAPWGKGRDVGPFAIWGQSGGIWDARSGKQVARFPDSHQWRGFDPSYRWALTVDRTDGSAHVWDTSTGKVVHRCVPKDSPDPSFDPLGDEVHLSTQGDRLLVLTQGVVRLWNLETNRQVTAIDKPGHFAPVRCVAQHAGAGLVASGDDEGVIHLWDRKDGKQVRCLLAERAGIKALAFTGDGVHLASVSGSGEIVLRELTGKTIWSSSILPSGTQIVGIAVDPTGNLLFVVTQDGRVVGIDAGKGRQLGEYMIDSSGIQSVALSPDGALLALGGRGGLVHLWDTGRKQTTRSLDAFARVEAVAFAGGGELLVTGGQSIALWEVATGRRQVDLRPQQGPVRALLFNQQTGELVVADAGEKVLLIPLPALFQRFQENKLGSSAFSLGYWANASTDAMRALGTSPGQLEWRQKADEFLKASNWSALIWVCSKAIERTPDDWQFWYWKGLGNLKVYDRSKPYWELAVADFSRALELKTDDPEIWHQRGLAYSRLRRWAEAIADYTRAIEVGSKDPASWSERGTAHGALHEYDLAIKDLDEARKRKPADRVTSILRADALLRKGDSKRVLQEVAEAPPGRVDSAAAWAVRGAAHRRQGKLEQALRDLNRALQLDPDSSLSYAERGEVYLRMQKLDVAQRDLDEAINLQQESPDALVARAQVHALRRDHGRAVTDLTDALEFDPRGALAHRLRGDAYRNLNAFDKAIADYDAALKLDPRDAKGRSGRGIAWLVKGDAAKAITDLDAAAALDRKAPEIFTARGFAHAAQGRTQEALADYDRAIQLDANLLPPLLYRGDLWRSEKKLERAIADYTRAGELQRGNPNVWSKRAHAYADLKHWDQAVADFGRMLDLAPQEYVPRYFHTLGLLGKGDTQGFRKGCLLLVERIRPLGQTTDAANLAWACLLLPNTLPEHDRLIQAARAMSAGDPKSYLFAKVLGAALLRAGLGAEAIEQLKRAAALQEPAPATWLLLAIAHERLGRADEADQWRGAAVKWMSKAGPEPRKGTSSTPAVSWDKLPWMEQLALECLRREAEELMAKRKPKGGDDPKTISPRAVSRDPGHVP